MHHKLVILFCALTLGALTSCTVNKSITEKQLVGEYIHNKKYGINSHLVLLPDKTFEYQWRVGLSVGSSKGEWIIHKKNVILNSDKQPSQWISSCYEITQEILKPGNVVSLKITDKRKQPVSSADCLISTTEGDKRGVASLAGVCNFENTYNVDKIIISSIGYKKVIYEPLKPANYFEITMLEENENYVFFTNKKLCIKKNKLILLNKNKKRESYKIVSKNY